MIRRLKAFVLWLESRFPEKVVVRAESYAELLRAVDGAQDELARQDGAMTNVLRRLCQVESDAVHKEAVQDLIAVVKALKDDVTALKANIGWDVKSAKADEITAMLNGEVI